MKLLVAGVVLGVLGIGSQIVFGWRADTTSENNAADGAALRVAMKDALKPLIREISAMPDMDVRDRPERVRAVSQSASSALSQLLLTAVDRPRANVYHLDPDKNSMTWIAYMGRGEEPGNFYAGSVAADAALERVQSGKTLVVKNMKSDAPKGATKDHYDYTSFVSVPIMSGSQVRYAYGMLTVDSQAEDAFTDTDVHMVTVVAELLALAFALAYPADVTAGSPRSNSQSSKPNVGPEG